MSLFNRSFRLLRVHWESIGVRQKQTIDRSRVPILIDGDLEEQFVKGSGPGGQSVQKTINCVVLTHKPTGFVVKCHQSRLQSQNRKLARELMITKLDNLYNGEYSVDNQKLAINTKKSLNRQQRQRKLEDMKMKWKQRENTEKAS